MSLKGYIIQYYWGFPHGQTVKNLPAMQETQVRPLGWEDALVKEMAIYSSILAWETPWTEEPDRQVYEIAKSQT